MSNTAREAQEFSSIFIDPGGTRPVMSPPPTFKASDKLIDQVRAELDIEDRVEAIEVADWLADKLERFGAYYSQPVFDMEGNGPMCSYCGAIWPLCGHHHLSGNTGDGDDDE